MNADADEKITRTETSDSDSQTKTKSENVDSDADADCSQEKTQTLQSKPKSGYAHIKSEFLLHNYKPTIQTEYLSVESKEKIASAEEKDQNQEDESNEPPSKKTKLTGRNKYRPRNERIEAKDKLCPSIKEGQECKFADRCKFTHNIKEFFEKKRPDIDNKCPVFETWGYCRAGVTCRYASGHIGENLENITKKELYESMKEKPRCLNLLREEIRNQLYRKRYDFKRSFKSINAVKEVQESFHSGSGTKPSICASEKQEAGVNTIDDVPIRSTSREIKKIDFQNKLYLAPLTTVGNLPFRRLCKNYGAEITCGEMAVAKPILMAKPSEWSLIKRHPSEDIFGVQLCGAYPDMLTKCAQLITETADVDFIDVNCGCPIDLIFQKGAGSALMGKVSKLEQICNSMMGVMDGKPLTVKLRTGVFDNKNTAHNIIPRLRDAGVSLVTIHGRSREQRYTKLADWDYISQCANLGSPMPVYGNGDILSYEDANLHMEKAGVSGVMVARGALIKPWIFTEIKEQRHWDISSGERFDMLKSFSNYGLEHWGSDEQGVETTRRFMLEWLSFLHRYIPVGVLEQVPQKINEKPPYYIGRNDLETLMASPSCGDWVKISEMLLGPVPSSFQFLPKHKANAYQ